MLMLLHGSFHVLLDSFDTLCICVYYLLIFCLNNLSIDGSGVLKSLFIVRFSLQFH